MINKVEALKVPAIEAAVVSDYAGGTMIRVTGGGYLSASDAQALRVWLDAALCMCCQPERKCPDHGACVTDGHV